MEIFKLVMADKDKAVIEVMVDNPLTVALHPYVKATYKYITVTRGKNHIMTVVRPDGDSFSISFGENGHTLISDNLAMLRTKVMEFLDNSGIMMEANVTEDELPQRISLYYNDYFKSWQVRYEFASGKSHSKFIESSPTEQYRQMAIETVNNRYHIKALDFVRGTCATGLPIWYAKKICVK